MIYVCITFVYMGDRYRTSLESPGNISRPVVSLKVVVAMMVAGAMKVIGTVEVIGMVKGLGAVDASLEGTPQRTQP